MKVESLMNEKVHAANTGSNLAEVARMMWDYDCGVVPIVDNDNHVMGVITDRDICIATASKDRAPSELTAGEVMAGSFFYCRPDDDIATALETMGQEQVRRLPVVDERDQLLGVLSINDVLLNAQSRKKNDAVSYNQAIDTLKAICEHRHRNAETSSQNTEEALATS